MTLLCTLSENIGDCISGHSLTDHFSGITDKESCSDGKRATVNDMDMSEFFSRNTAILIGTGEGTAEIDMNDFVTGSDPWLKMVNIFCNVYSSRLGKNLFIIIFLENLFRSDVDAVLIVMTVQDDMERKVMHMVTLF